MQKDIYQLETDLLDARRVADERLEMLGEEQRANKVLQERVEELEKRIKILYDGLEIYAERDNWVTGNDGFHHDEWNAVEDGWTDAQKYIEKADAL